MSDEKTLPSEQYITKAAYARHRNVTPQSVNDYRLKGHLVTNEAGDRVDWRATDIKLGDTVDPIRGGDRSESSKSTEKNRSSAGAGLLKARTQEAEARAKKAALDVAKALEEVVSAKDVEESALALATAAREALMAIPDRLSDVLAAESDASKVRTLLTKEIKHLCRKLSGEAQDEDG